MQTFKTSKCELLFCVLPKDVEDVTAIHTKEFDITVLSYRLPNVIIMPYHFTNIQGNWQLLGKISTITEDAAKELVDAYEWEDSPEFGPRYAYNDYFNGIETNDYSTKYPFDTSIESLTSIATHLGMDTNDNIYLLKKL